MRGFVESFNISVACAITLFCATLGAVSNERKCPLLSENEKQELKSKWLKKDVRNADLILKEIGPSTS